MFRRDRPLNVSGVGPRSVRCDYDCRLPIALNQVDPGSVPANFHAPIIPNSPLPPLLGIDTLRDYRSIIDTNSHRIYLLGNGPYNIEGCLPRGTVFLQGEVVPSGHLVIPSDGYAYEIGTITGSDNGTPASGEAVSSANIFPDHGGDSNIPEDTTFTAAIMPGNEPGLQGSHEASSQWN